MSKLALNFHIPLQPGSFPSQPLINLDEAGHWSLADATPNCGQSPVFRRPAKHLQTTADFRLGRQVILAQPSASSQGSRLRRAVQSSTSSLGVGFSGIVSLFLLLELSAQHLLLVISLNTIMHYSRNVMS